MDRPDYLHRNNILRVLLHIAEHTHTRHRLEHAYNFNYQHNFIFCRIKLHIQKLGRILVTEYSDFLKFHIYNRTKWIKRRKKNY